jgi:hypothetical protein
MEERLFVIMMAWILNSHPGFNAQVQQMLTYVLEYRNEIGFNATHLNGIWFDLQFKDTYTPYSTIYVKWRNLATRTVDVIADLERLESEMRKFYSAVRDLVTAAPYVTNAQLRLMGFPERHASGGRVPAGVAKMPPVVSVISRVIGRLGFSIGSYDSENKVRKHKPEGQHGAEFRWKFSETPVNDVDLLDHSDFTTKTEFFLTFKSPERGKTIYFAARWENRRGEKGPWTPIYPAIIP